MSFSSLSFVYSSRFEILEAGHCGPAARCPSETLFNVLWYNVSQLSKSTNHERT